MSLCSSLTHSGGPAERNIQEGNLYTHCRNQWAGPTIQKKRTAAQSTHATVGYVSSLLDMLKWHRNLTSLHPAYYCRTFSYQDEAKKNDLKKRWWIRRTRWRRYISVVWRAHVVCWSLTHDAVILVLHTLQFIYALNIYSLLGYICNWYTRRPGSDSDDSYRETQQLACPSGESRSQHGSSR